MIELKIQKKSNFYSTHFMSNILIIYSSTDGHTIKICDRLMQFFTKKNNAVDLISVNKVTESDLNMADKIIIGASIRYGKHSKDIYQLVKHYQHLLENKVNAFFSVNVVARKIEKSTPETNPYLKRFLQQIAWKPQNLAVFAGKIDYQKYNYFDRTLIRLIMLITKGPTAPDTNIEFTNWDKVTEFARHIDKL